MEHYYVDNNRVVNGYHLVHKESCPHFASMTSKTYLGAYVLTDSALESAQEYHTKAAVCPVCSESGAKAS